MDPRELEIIYSANEKPHVSVMVCFAASLRKELFLLEMKARRMGFEFGTAKKN